MTEKPHPEGTTAADLIAGLAGTQAMAEATAQYYRKLTEGGIPAESAGRMAEQYHNLLVKMAIIATDKAIREGKV